MARIGWVSCGVCGNPEASVSENTAGTLSVSCHKCQYSGYAKAGTKAARTIRAALKSDDDTPPAAPHAAPPKAEPKPAPPSRPKNSIFDLGTV